MRFYLGTHMVNWLADDRFAGVRLFLSAVRLRQRVRLPAAAGPWALDSGGFSTIASHGCYLTGPREYVSEVVRWRDQIGNLEWAAIQDWMCEPQMLAKTRRTVAEHQQLTVNSWIALNAINAEIPWVPVIQGYSRDDYLRCVDLYDSHCGYDIRNCPVVGVGSVCRRQGTLEAKEILTAIRDAGFDNLHAFGYKIDGLRMVHGVIASADSMAWSRLARFVEPMDGCLHNNCANCPKFALRWADSVARITEGNDMSEGTKRTVNKLDAVKTGKLYAWLDSHRDEMSPDKMTKDEVAKLASEQLGFAVNGNNIYGLASGMSIKLKGVGDRGERKPAFDPAPILAELNRQKAELELIGKRLAAHDQHIDELLKSVNGVVPMPKKKSG